MSDGVCMRKELLEFSNEMECVMSVHDINKRDSWKNMSMDELVKKLHEEYNEVLVSDISSKELVDLANVCMMLWNRIER